MDPVNVQGSGFWPNLNSVA